MASSFIELKGKVKWFRPTTPDTKFGDAKWKHVLYPDEASLQKFRDLQKQGLKNTLKKDDDGYYISLSRRCQRTWQGKVTNQLPPIVKDKDGNVYSTANVNIGNGSDVTDRLRLYQYTDRGTGKKMPAIEWDSTMVHNLVPYEGPRGVFDIQEQAEPSIF